jgi:hypothetical protein
VSELYPHLQPDEISVRQAGDLPAPFSGFHLAMDTLGVQLYPSRYRVGLGVFHPLECALTWRTTGKVREKRTFLRSGAMHDTSLLLFNNSV